MWFNNLIAFLKHNNGTTAKVTIGRILEKSMAGEPPLEVRFRASDIFVKGHRITADCTSFEVPSVGCNRQFPN